MSVEHEDVMTMLYDSINRNKSCGLSCFEVEDSPWTTVITRRVHDWKHEWIQLGRNLYSDLNPLIWNSTKDNREYGPAIVLYPMNALDDTRTHFYFMSHSSIKHPKIVHLLSTKRNRRLHRVLSRVQYPFLKEIRCKTSWLQEFRKKKMLRNELVMAAIHPLRYAYFIRCGGDPEEWMDGIE